VPPLALPPAPPLSAAEFVFWLPPPPSALLLEPPLPAAELEAWLPPALPPLLLLPALLLPPAPPLSLAPPAPPLPEPLDPHAAIRNATERPVIDARILVITETFAGSVPSSRSRVERPEQRKTVGLEAREH
jgi:hypothetical protein